MRKVDKMFNIFFYDIHSFLLVTVSCLLLLNLNFLGTLGLVIYGIMIAYSAFFFILNYKKRQDFCKKPFIFYFIIAYYSYFLFAVFINGSFSYNGPALIQLFLLYLIVILRQNNAEILEDIKSVAKILTVFGLIAGIGSIGIAIFTYYYPEAVSLLPEKIGEVFFNMTQGFPLRLAGYRYHPNGTAQACFTSLMFSIYLLSIADSSKWKVLSLLNCFIAVYLIVIATNSRTNIVCLALFLFLYFIIYFFVLNKENKQLNKIKNSIVIITLGLLLVFSLIVFFYEPAKEFLFSRVLRVSSIKDASGRDDVYKIAYELGQGHRILGYDMHQLRVAGNVDHAHNLFLQLLSAGGIPTLALFCISFFITIFFATKNLIRIKHDLSIRKLNCFFFCFIICYFIQGIPEISGVDNMSPFAICSQIIFAYINVIDMLNSRKVVGVKNY